MKMTFNEYIINPMGIKNSVYTNRFIYRDLYTKKLDIILIREMGLINYFLYKSKNEYYIHLKIPSEVIKKFYYDVVIEFYTDKYDIKNSKTLKNYYVKFYANDPAFVYTFAYSMLHNDMFIRDLTPRMSKEAVKKAAKIKNPKNEIGYVKSIYFAYLIMKRDSLFNKSIYETNGSKFNKKKLLNNIEHADSKVAKRKQAEIELREKKRKYKKKKIKKKSDFKASKKSNNIKNINKTKKINNIAFTKTSKKI